MIIYLGTMYTKIRSIPSRSLTTNKEIYNATSLYVVIMKTDINHFQTSKVIASINRRGEEMPDDKDEDRSN